MLFKLLVLCVVLLFPLVFGNTGYRGHAKHPTLPEHCYYEELDLAIPVNASELPVGIEGICQQFHCREDYVIVIQNCGRQSCIEGPSDYSLPHPKCCPACVRSS